MPNVTAASVLAEAQSVYLNDASANLFTNTVLTPFLMAAYEHFRNECALNGINIEYRTATKTIAAGAITYGTLPTDFLLPIRIDERTTGSTDPYIPMQECRILPQIDQSSSLVYWAWFDSDIKFVGSTQSNDILLTYFWDLAPDAVTAATTDLRGNCRSFLAAKTAALASMFVNQNDTLAGRCDQVAESQLTKIIGIMVRNTQGTPVRQVPFGRRRSFSY
jgi:hypothetical protein